jgi:hypothetical protein
MSTTVIINKMDEAAEGAMAKSKYQWYIASEAIAKGDVVSLDLSKSDGNRALYVVKADAAQTTDSLPIGCAALAAAAAGDKIKVCIAGYFEGANVDGATAQGDLLQIGATAGRLDVRTTAIDEGGAATYNLLQIFACALEADVANAADIWIYPQF